MFLVAEPLPPGSIASLIGSLDSPAAGVLAVMFVVIGVIATSLILKRRSKVELSNEFELAKMRLQNENDLKVKAQDQSHQRQVQVNDNTFNLERAKIETGLITSHARDVTGTGHGDAEG